ncbi:uncharacterized protein LOC110974857 [Acanthaster planci]|uniref:Thromboxane-A synthase n=1 Tax=Acanthaster planci TaxID=133434 RepID=A0A8B7XNR5_ACAPL|nr:uncharacterized protein LOC110974857 [Acanthaster planci]
MEVFGFGVSMTLFLVVGTVLIFAWYDWWCHQYFQRRGIPVGIWKALDEYREKYGKIVGTYDFQCPVLIVSDPIIIKHILVKSFSNFHNRWTRPIIRYDRSPVGRGMFFLEDGDWKNIRNTLTPSFTAAKMKQMPPVINECCDTLITSISEARTGGKAVDCKALFGAFTMDVIACCAFGLNVDSQKDKDDPFVQNAKILLDAGRFTKPFAILISIFPFLARLFGFLGAEMAFDKKATKFFQDVTEATCKLRKEEGATALKERIDLLQLMLNAHNDPDTDLEDTPIAENGLEGGMAQRKPLSTEDIMAQGVQFFLAGYETTNTLLTFTAYLLATNQHVQEKLHAEIDNLAPTRDNLGYDVIAKMEYLDMVISESLRMYPPVIFLERLCNETVSCDGFVIEKGVTLVVPVWSLHYEEEYWKNPTKFDPERFSPENKATVQPFTYLPFGFGPRICFGMRFALLEGKMALVRVMQQYRFDVSSETEIDDQIYEGSPAWCELRLNMELFGFELSTTWVLVACVVLMLAWYDRWCHQYFQRRGIPVAGYVPIFGNRLQWLKGICQTFAGYHKECGKVFGVYDFRRPILFINDPEILKHIMVKNFSNFYNHTSNPLIKMDPSPVGRGLFFLENEDWKNIRNTLTPSFTAAKMKYMTPLINGCSDTLLKSIDEARRGDKAVDCREVFGGFTMDVIASCAFGLNVDSQKNKDDPFVQNAKILLSGRGFNSTWALLASLFPFLAPWFAHFGIGLVFDPKSVKFFLGVTEAAFKMRKEEGATTSKHIDLLQLMLNAHNDPDTDPEDTPMAEDGLRTGRVTQRKPLSTRDVMAQAVQFFLAGYETTNSLLTFTAYLLATNQDVQEKLHAEIDNLAHTKDNLGYDVIAKMEYLDMVINESLRMYPPLSFTDRRCNQTLNVDGLVIEKGVTVFVGIWNLHHNEEFWTNPNKFDPERFSPENKVSIKPFTYLPFGFGPRICFGMRFALMEGKMALVRVMQQYRFDVSSETEIPIRLSKTGLIAPNKLMLDIVPRK